MIDRRVGSGSYVTFAPAVGQTFGLLIPELGQTEIFEPICRGMAEAQKMTASLSSALIWLREGHRRLHESIAAIADDDLMVQRKVHYGGTAETRFIISVVIEHDLYHAGEINHLRALRQGTDGWP